MPTIGPAFEPLPADPGERGRSRAAARRTPGPARPRRHPRLQPLVRARGAARPARADPDRALAEGRPVSAAEAAAARADPGRRRDRRRAGAGRRLPRRRRLLLRAGEDPGPLQAPALDATPKACRRSPSSSRSRPSTAPPASSGSAARRWPRRWRRRRRRERFNERYGINDAKLARAIRAGLLRAVDDAEDAGALSPLLGGPLRTTIEESRSTRRSN